MIPGNESRYFILSKGAICISPSLTYAIEIIFPAPGSAYIVISRLFSLFGFGSFGSIGFVLNPALSGPYGP